MALAAGEFSIPLRVSPWASPLLPVPVERLTTTPTEPV